MKARFLVAGVVMLACLLAYLVKSGEWPGARADHVESKLKLVQRADADLRRDCGDVWSMRVFLILGQSNAANHGEGRATSAHGLAWSENACFMLADPVPGGTGSGGSIWPRFADAWFARTGERSLFLVLAIDATSVGEWAGNPHLVHRFEALLDALRQHELSPDAVFWQQGEADARRSTSTASYTENLRAVIARLRAGGVSSPVFLARSTRCRSEAAEPIRAAVDSLIDPGSAILAGPDTDRIGLGLRHDGCHFGAEGLAQAAAAWVDTVAGGAALEPLASSHPLREVSRARPRQHH